MVIMSSLNSIAVIPVVASLLFAIEVKAENEPHRKGVLSLTFTESDPRGDMQEMLKRKFPAFEIDDKGIGKGEAYDVSSRTFEVVVPDGYDPKVPAPLFVWVSAGMSGRVEGNLAAALAKRGFIYVGPSKAGNDVYPPYRYRAAMDAVLNMKKLYNINPKQVYFGGNSGGGRTASMGCIIYPEIFTGGGFYVIGCNFWDSMPAGRGSSWPGFWPKRDQKLFEQGRNHAYVFLTGSKDFNRDGTEAAYRAYLKAGFPNCFYNETPGLGHEMPPAADIEKAFAFLDRFVFADAFAAVAQAEKSCKTHFYAQAAKKLVPFRGTCAAVDKMWDELVAKAEGEADNVLSAKKIKPSARIAKLKQVERKFGPAATERVKREIETLEASPEYVAEQEAAKSNGKKSSKK